MREADRGGEGHAERRLLLRHGAVRSRRPTVSMNPSATASTAAARSAPSSVAWLTVPHASFRFTAGVPTSFRSSAEVTRRFCGTCGTSLTYEHDAPPNGDRHPHGQPRRSGRRSAQGSRARREPAGLGGLGRRSTDLSRIPRPGLKPRALSSRSCCRKDRASSRRSSARAAHRPAVALQSTCGEHRPGRVAIDGGCCWRLAHRPRLRMTGASPRPTLPVMLMRAPSASTIW